MNDLEVINNYVFADCTSLAVVNLDASWSNLKHIGVSAFSRTALTHFRFPNSIRTIGYAEGVTPQSEIVSGGVFDYCTNLVTAGAWGTKDSHGNPVTVEYPWIDVPDYVGWNTLEEYRFTGLETSIGKCAFYYTKLSGVIDLSFCNQLSIIKKFAFMNNGQITTNRITEVKLPSNLITIEKEAFENCKNLYTLTIPSSVRNIGRDICYNCTALTNVTIKTTSIDPAYQVNLPEDAWFRQTSLSCVLKIPASVIDNPQDTYGYHWNYYGEVSGAPRYLTVQAFND